MKYIFFCIILIAQISLANSSESNTFIKVINQDFVADYFPTKEKNKYGIIVLTGSSGGKANDTAKLIASLGYPVLSLAYFKDDFLPEALEMIPLEYFQAPKRWLMERSESRDDGVILIGFSKGAELALVLAANDNDYKGTIAVAPSAVIWAGIPKDRSKITSASSSWSLNGKPLPFIPYINRAKLKEVGLNKMADWHTVSLANAENPQSAFIPVEKISSPVLLLSGGNDLSWPANQMAKSICKRMNINKKLTCTHINYKNQGHMISSDKEFNAQKKGKEVIKEINQFLAKRNKV